MYRESTHYFFYLTHNDSLRFWNMTIYKCSLYKQTGLRLVSPHSDLWRFWSMKRHFNLHLYCYSKQRAHYVYLTCGPLSKEKIRSGDSWQVRRSNNIGSCAYPTFKPCKKNPKKPNLYHCMWSSLSLFCLSNNLSSPSLISPLFP